MARVDFVSIEKIDPTNKTATLAPGGRLVTPVAALVRLARAVGVLQRELVAQPSTTSVPTDLA